MLATRSRQGLASYRREILSLSPAAWFRAGEGQTVTGSGVSQWSDQSGNARHLLQGTDSARPALQADGSVLFNGSAHYLQTGAFTVNQPATVVIAVKQVSWTLGDHLFNAITNNVTAFQSASTPQLQLFAGSAVATNSNLAVGALGIVAAQFNGASSFIRVNNTTNTAGNPGATGFDGFTMGARGTAASFSNIQAYEALILPIAPSTAQLDRIVAQMMAIYSVS